MTALVALISLPFFNLKAGNAQSGNQYAELYRMVLDIIPGNLFTPFSHGNTLQIMFIGVIVGLMMLMIGKDMQVVADLVEQFGYIVDGIMGFISRLIPLFVFGSLFSILASSELGVLAAGRRQRRAGIHWMRTGWSRLPQAVARLLYGKDAHRCVYFWLRLECVSKIPNMHFRRLSLPFIVDFP